MREWIAGLEGLESLFLYSAVLGGSLFVVRMVLQFVGIGGDDADGVDGADADVGDVDGGHVHHSSDASFKLLSLHGITAFFMMFGLVGLALKSEDGVADGLALGGATLAGAFTMWLIQLLFTTMARLQSSGSLDLSNAIGEIGTVYLTVPPGGTGKVQVTLQGRTMVIDAVGEKPLEVRTGDRVRVVGVTGNGTLVVERVV